MKRRTYHVTPDDGDWKVKERGAERAVKVLEDKSDAVQLAKDLAKSAGLGQVIIHKSDGTIQTEHTYGRDPEKYPG
ncbi:MAG: hypothetical protein A3C50_02045 [Candidatus Staskawiczbacteria bacterium RIFCSPHIGHO2_02_FULL_43_16]|nr:MAG: hypothetical protein A3C50_02045 [Candidatus Staskawiczbacteria bacterium RIFCSPHIGHO2_02_FULL_43_16]